jgi:hypothetical protein
VLHGIPNPFGCALSPPDIKDPLCFYYSNYARRMLALCIGVKLNCTLELREPADNRAVVRTVPYHLLRPGLKVFRTVPYILWGTRILPCCGCSRFTKQGVPGKPYDERRSRRGQAVLPLAWRLDAARSLRVTEARYACKRRRAPPMSIPSSIVGVHTSTLRVRWRSWKSCSKRRRSSLGTWAECSSATAVTCSPSRIWYSLRNKFDP